MADVCSTYHAFSLRTRLWCREVHVPRVPSRSCSQAVSKPVWHIPLLCIQWKTPDNGQWNCPKHVEFYCKNKFGKLLHLVGFVIRIYHEARPPERQICLLHVSNIMCSSSGRPLVLAVCYGMFVVYLCKQSSRWKDVLDMHGKHTMHVPMVFLMKNTWCSKHVEDTKDWIKPLI